MLAAAALVVAAGVVLAIAKPGDLGGTSKGTASATTTTVGGAATTLAGTTTTPATATTSPPGATSPGTATTSPTATSRPGSGLGQPGAAVAETTTAATGGESMIGAALVLVAAGLALRRVGSRLDAT